MATPLIRRRGRALVLVAALATALAFPAAALADTTAPPTIGPADSRGATITLTGGPVVGRLVANTTIGFTCDPFLVYDWNTGQETEVTTGALEGGGVTILQVAGRTINHGSANVYGGTIVCDGTTVNRRDVQVVASVVPWKSGSAVAGAWVHIASPDFQSSHYGSTGAVTIKLGR